MPGSKASWAGGLRSHKRRVTVAHGSPRTPWTTSGRLGSGTFRGLCGLWPLTASSSIFWAPFTCPEAGTWRGRRASCWGQGPLLHQQVRPTPPGPCCFLGHLHCIRETLPNHIRQLWGSSGAGWAPIPVRKAETQNKATEEQQGCPPAPCQPWNTAGCPLQECGGLFTTEVTRHINLHTDSRLPGSWGPQELTGYLCGPAHFLTPQMPLDIFWRVE